MRSFINFIAVSSVIALASAQSWPSSAPAAGQSFRVFGGQAPATKSGNTWRSGNLATEAPLPDSGYVAPTPQDAIEIKTYGTYRRASFDSDSLFLKGFLGQSRAFWALFNHIKGRNIPMTAPVEMEYRNLDASRSFLGDLSVSWKMNFLYERPQQGATGNAGSNVFVSDTQTATYISIGVEGNMGYDLVNKGVDRLRQVLGSQNTWVAAGEPRALGYNSPYTWYKWVEVQIPVRLA